MASNYTAEEALLQLLDSSGDSEVEFTELEKLDCANITDSDSCYTGNFIAYIQ